MDPTKKRPIDDVGDMAQEMNRRDNKSRRTHNNNNKEGDDNNIINEEQEKEIEEFFAILRRLHVALRYLHKTDSSPATATTTATSAVWKPTFEPQDFQDQLSHSTTDSGFDLNSEPTCFNHHHHPSA